MGWIAIGCALAAGCPRGSTTGGPPAAPGPAEPTGPAPAPATADAAPPAPKPSSAYDEQLAGFGPPADPPAWSPAKRLDGPDPRLEMVCPPVETGRYCKVRDDSPAPEYAREPKLFPAQPPFVEVRQFEYGDDDERDIGLAIQAGKSWFHLLDVDANVGSWHEAGVTRVEVLHSRLLVHFHREEGKWQVETEDSVRVCGINKGAVSCTGPIPEEYSKTYELKELYDEDDNPLPMPDLPDAVYYHAEITLTDADHLTIRPADPASAGFYAHLAPGQALVFP